LTTTAEPNPLAEGLHEYRVLDPSIMVIFGATGDLSTRKLLPALFTLASQRLLPPGFAVVGAAKDEISEDEFRARVEKAIRSHARVKEVGDDVVRSMVGASFYQRLDFGDTEGFKTLRRRLEELDEVRHTGGNRVFYCATPPPTFPVIVKQLGQAGMALQHDQGWERIVIEKPFGTNLETARELNRQVSRIFREDGVYRIDHYLGKETVQNVLAFRFANSIFEPIWNNQYVDSVQITVAEELGVEGRGGYYDRSGALRDIIQNHAMQLLSLVAMEPPIAFDAGALRDEKVKVLRSIRPIVGEHVDHATVRAQYTRGWVQGQEVPAYKEEESVAGDSKTESYAALELRIDNWRWAHVPFYVRSGKRMPKRVSEIRVQFKRPPHLTFGRAATHELEPNAITLRIQPEEGISLRFGAKVPTAGIKIRSVNMDFLYASSFLVDAPDAYERLIMDCMLGDATLFTRADEVEAAWALVDPIETRWGHGQPKLASYAAGTWGPKEADELLARQGRQWHRP
jgi:glucose-6-phosphate 1-dehydrogenase